MILSSAGGAGGDGREGVTKIPKMPKFAFVEGAVRYVYLIYWPRRDIWKIGISSDPERRLREIKGSRTGREDAYLDCCARAFHPFAVEASMLRRYRRQNVWKREWFEFTALQVEEVRAALAKQESIFCARMVVLQDYADRIRREGPTVEGFHAAKDRLEECAL